MSAVAVGSIKAPDLALRYHWTARLADGNLIHQGNDKSPNRSPSNPTPSAFYDLCQKDEIGELICHVDGRAKTREDIEQFWLEGQGMIYLVDLRDGHFEGGVAPVDVGLGSEQKPHKLTVKPSPFWLSIPPAGSKLSLYYYRLRREHFSLGGDGLINGHIAAECYYQFGWEVELENGEFFRQLITLV